MFYIGYDLFASAFVGKLHVYLFSLFSLVSVAELSGSRRGGGGGGGRGGGLLRGQSTWR